MTLIKEIMAVAALIFAMTGDLNTDVRVQYVEPAKQLTSNHNAR